jgi:hypothetical protein
MDLIETTVRKPKIVEANRSKLPEGVLYRVTYPICNVGMLNANNRVYERDVWEKVLEDPELQEKQANRVLFGQAEHPAETQSDLQLTSHVIFETWMDKDTVYQKMDILDTPTGRILETLLKAGCQVGVSTRAEGDLEEYELEEGGEKKSCQRVVAETYRYVTTDFTADPSTFNVMPQEVERNVLNTVSGLAKEGKMSVNERKFATALLESVRCAECKCGGNCKVTKLVDELRDPTPEEDAVDARKQSKVNKESKVNEDSLELMPIDMEKGIKSFPFERYSMNSPEDIKLEFSVPVDDPSDWPGESYVESVTVAADGSKVWVIAEEKEQDPGDDWFYWEMDEQAEGTLESVIAELGVPLQISVLEKRGFQKGNSVRATQESKVKEDAYDEIKNSKVDERGIPTEGGVSPKLAVGNLVRDPKGTILVVKSLDNQGLRFDPAEGGGVNISPVVSWSDLEGYVKISESIRSKVREGINEDRWSGIVDTVGEDSKWESVIDLIAQVWNGGFSQWIYNDFAQEDGKLVIAMLNKLGTEAAGKTIDLVSQALNSDLFLRGGEMDEVEHEEAMEALDSLDNEFFAGLDKELVADLGSKFGVPDDYDEEDMEESKAACVKISESLKESLDESDLVRFEKIIQRIATLVEEAYEITRDSGNETIENEAYSYWRGNIQNALGEDYSEYLGSSGSSMQKTLEKLRNVASEKGGDYDDDYDDDYDEEDMEESKAACVKNLQNEIIDLKVAEGCSRAGYEVAVGLLQESNDATLTAKILQSKLTEATKELSELSVTASKDFEEKNAENSSLCKVLETKAKKVVELDKALTEAVEKVVDLELELEQNKVLHEQHQEELVSASTKAVKEGRIQVIKEYFELKLENHQMQADDNTRALLEDCQNLTDVNCLVERLVEIARKGALHTKPLTTVQIQESNIDKDPEAKRIDGIMGKMFRG